MLQVAEILRTLKQPGARLARCLGQQQNHRLFLRADHLEQTLSLVRRLYKQQAKISIFVEFHSDLIFYLSQYTCFSTGNPLRRSKDCIVSGRSGSVERRDAGPRPAGVPCQTASPYQVGCSGKRLVTRLRGASGVKVPGAVCSGKRLVARTRLSCSSRARGEGRTRSVGGSEASGTGRTRRAGWMDGLPETGGACGLATGGRVR